MSKFIIDHLSSGGIITNYFCTSKCGHCLYNCSPAREKEYLALEKADEILDIVGSLGCRSIHIGGGEPMLRMKKLGEIIKRANNAGIYIEYVETNSSWYKDETSADLVLTQLREKGLNTLLISISPFHNEYIPFSKVRGVIQACSRNNIGVFPWKEFFIDEVSSFEQDSTHDLIKYINRFGDDYLVHLPDRYWIHLGGRALNTFRPILSTQPLNQILTENPGNCIAELTNTSHFHIDLFGNYIPGLCAGIAIDTKDLGHPLLKKKYPLITILSSDGINGLYQMAREKSDFSPSRPEYLNKCDLCSDIRNFLFKKGFNQTELSPEGFYKAME